MMTNAEWDWTGGLPTSHAEFVGMMRGLDSQLISQGIPPVQRPMEAARLLSMRLGYSGKPLLPLDRIEIKQPFDAGWCIRASWLWFEAAYGRHTEVNFGPGPVVIDLNGCLWRMRMPQVYGGVRMFVDRDLSNIGVNLSMSGQAPANLNVLCQVDGMTQLLADSLSQASLANIFTVCQLGFTALTTLTALIGDDFFQQARGEYRHSVDTLLAGDWAKARYDTALCAEKVFKGLLHGARKVYPTSGKNGHHIPLLGGLLSKELGIELDMPSLEAVHCPTKVRYGEIKSSKVDGLRAHRALLKILESLPVAPLNPLE